MRLSQLDRAKLKGIFSYLLEITDGLDNEFKIMEGCKEIVKICEKEQINKKQYTIGKYYPEYGVYAGIHNQNHVFVAGEDLEYDNKIEFTRDKAMELAEEKGVKLPTVGECALICENLEIIKKGLKDNGLKELNGWYWSSSEYNYYDAWISGFSYSNGLDWDYKFNGYYVRPVLALPIGE